MRMPALRWLALACLLCCTPAALAASDEETGREMFEQITAQIPVYEDPALADYVNALGQKLVAQADDVRDTFTFTVLDSPDINAFATPGGYIYVNRGLIGYLTSEAQLAAVLAHEIAHVTARHAARQKRAQTTSNVAAGLLTILTGSGDVGEATALWGAAAVRGYGRDMELEADGLGAKFMARAGYDRGAVIEVLSLLKDHERVEKKRARDAGREPRTYHGLFATHPRSDQRLKEVIAEQGAGSTGGKTGKLTFRLATDKLVWGENFAARQDRPNRFYDRQHLYRFDYPEGWTINATQGGASGQGPVADTGDTATLIISLKRRTTQSPKQFIKNTLGISPLRKTQDFITHGLAGHTGLASEPNRRLAVIYYGYNAVIIEGALPEGKSRDAADKLFLTMIQSFAPLPAVQAGNREPRRIHYVKATDNTTFAALAHYLKLGKGGEEQLRLINGYYPRGEPVDGEWIKIIR